MTSIREFPRIAPGTPLPEAVRQLAAAEIRTVHVALVDLFGSLRERRVALADLEAVAGDGATFANVLPHWDAGEHVFGEGPFGGESITVDTASFRPYPFEADASVVFADYTGPSATCSPRRLLERQVEKLTARGWCGHAALETEFIVLEENATTLREKGFERLRPFAVDNRCWAAESAAQHGELVAALEALLARGGIEPLALGLELGPGCFEATLRHTEPLRAAEDLLLFKLYTKAFFRQRGMTAVFMAQLAADLPGLSQHAHLSLGETAGAANLFVHDGAMTPLMAHFIGGLLALIPEAMALTHATPNAYRRIAPGNWAPKNASWAEQNYAAAVRVVTGPDARGRLEYRLPGADANPYLNLAFALGAGLWGIEHEAPLPAAYTGGNPATAPAADDVLPHDLHTATRRLAASARSADIWGSAFIAHFTRVLAHEDASLRRHTSAAERSRYLEIL